MNKYDKEFALQNELLTQLYLLSGSGGVVEEYQLLRSHDYPDVWCKLKDGREFLFECKNLGNYILKTPTTIKWTGPQVLAKRWNDKEYATAVVIYECNTKREGHQRYYHTIVRNTECPPKKLLVQTYVNFDDQSKQAPDTAGIEIIELKQATWEGTKWQANMATAIVRLFK